MTLIASIVAWIAGRRWSRWVLIALVLVATILRLYQVAQTLLSRSASIGEVSGSLAGLAQPLALCQLPLLIIVPMYITPGT